MAFFAALLAIGTLAAPPVQLDMKNVRFHADDRVVMQIDTLRGEMVPKDGQRVVLADPKSYDVHVRDGDVSLGSGALESSMEEIVFARRRSGVRPTGVSFHGDRLIIHGRLKGLGIPFSIESKVSANRDGRIRLHPVKVRGLGIPVGGLARWLGVKLGRTAVKIGKPVGLEADGDDLLMDASRATPPPRIVGPVVDARVEHGALHLRFGRAPGLTTGADQDPAPPEPEHPNRIWMHGGVLVIGRLTMDPTEMEIVDVDPADPFDFQNTRFGKQQLPHGGERVLPDGGLVVYMRDWEDITKSTRPAAVDARTAPTAGDRTSP